MYEIFAQIGKRLLPLITPKTTILLGSATGDLIQPTDPFMIGGLTVDQITRGLWIIFCIYYCIGLGVRGVFLKERIPDYCSSGHKFSILD